MKVDTGLNRNGVAAADYPDLLTALGRAVAEDSIRVARSHVAPVARRRARPSHQRSAGAAPAGDARSGTPARLPFEIAHLSNSPATLARPDLAFDMVRPGVAVYGLNPLTGRDDAGLVPAMTLKAPVALVKSVRAGDGVSYGHTWIADRDTTVALVPLGYADGVFRALSGRIDVLVNGRLRQQRRPNLHGPVRR